MAGGIPILTPLTRGVGEWLGGETGAKYGQALGQSVTQAYQGQPGAAPVVVMQPPPPPGPIDQAWAWVKENPGKTALGAAAAWYLKTKL